MDFDQSEKRDRGGKFVYLPMMVLSGGIEAVETLGLTPPFKHVVGEFRDRVFVLKDDDRYRVERSALSRAMKGGRPRGASGGSFGTVIDGYDTRLGRPVKIKIVRKIPVGFRIFKQWEYDGEAIRVLQREARILANLSHPGVCEVYDLTVVRDPGDKKYQSPAMIMEAIPGVELGSIRGKTEAVFKMVLPLAEALDYIHEKQIYHGDLSTRNVILRDGDPDKPVLLDFGLSGGDYREDASVAWNGSLDGADAGATSGSPGANSDIVQLAALVEYLLGNKLRGKMEVKEEIRRAKSLEPKVRHASAAELARQLTAAAMRDKILR